MDYPYFPVTFSYEVLKQVGSCPGIASQWPPSSQAILMVALRRIWERRGCSCLPLLQPPASPWAQGDTPWVLRTDQAPAGLPHLMNNCWAHDISEWDGEPVLPPRDGPRHGACPTSVLWPVSENISWIRPSQDLGRAETEFCLEQEQSAKGSKLTRKGEVHGFNFSLPGTGVLVNTCLGSRYSQWR